MTRPRTPFRSPPFRLGAALAACALAHVSCIERSNPFDPLNSNPQVVAEIRSRNKAMLDSLTADGSGITAFLAELEDWIKSDSALNAATANGNQLRRDGNLSIQAANAASETHNRANPASPALRKKSALAMLDTLKMYGPYPGFDLNRLTLENRSAGLSGFFSKVNSESSPVIVYDQPYIDSVRAPFRADSLALARHQAFMEAANAAVAAANLASRAYNDSAALRNSAAFAYNDSIEFTLLTRNRNVIVRADSLQAGTFVAKAGDSLYLGPGVFNVDLRFTNSGTVDSPIVVRGFPGLKTILRAPEKNGVASGSAMILSNRRYIRFEDLVFRRGLASGVKLESGSRDIGFRHCRFDSSGKFGLEAVDSDLELEDCLVVENGGGIRVAATPNSDFRIRFTHVLVARNGGHGLESVSPLGEIVNCTFADNGGDGIRIISPLRTLIVANSIVASNKSAGVFREPSSLNPEGLAVRESDVWGNLRTDWDLAGLDSAKAQGLIRSSLNVNPRFVAPESLDYVPRTGSKLSIYETQALPVVIGYRPRP